MDTIQDKLAQAKDSTDIARHKEQHAPQGPIELGTLSASTKGSPLGNKGDGGNGLQAF